MLSGNAADQTASIASAAVRGAVVGAAGNLSFRTIAVSVVHVSACLCCITRVASVCAGGGMALMLGPTAPTETQQNIAAQSCAAQLNSCMFFASLSCHSSRRTCGVLC